MDFPSWQPEVIPRLLFMGISLLLSDLRVHLTSFQCAVLQEGEGQVSQILSLKTITHFQVLIFK